MIEREDIVAAIVDAAGGTLTGRVRLQKTVYLLVQLGFEAELPFEYHHYGPYSRELDNATTDAKAFGLISEVYEYRQSDGALFSVFKLTADAAIREAVYGTFGRDRVAELVHRFADTNVTVLELAATIDWLWRAEEINDWRSEITKRKGKKVLGGRLEKAIVLLHSLGLAPPKAGQ